MALIKQFGLGGVNENVQFGKGNGRLKFDNSANAFSIRNLADASYVNIRIAEPIINRDAATKYYVDSVAQGLKPKEAVKVATNSLTTVDDNVNSGNVDNDMSRLSYNSGNDTWSLAAGGNGYTIDNVVLGNGDRVLVKDGTGAAAVGNGIFTYSGGTLTRATDADNRSPSGEAAASATNDIIVQGTKSDPNFAINKTYTFTANGISYTYGPTTNSDRNFYTGLAGLNCPGFSIGFHSDNGLTNAVQITYTPQGVGDQLVIADTTGWTHTEITHGTYTSTGANAAGSELGGGAFAFVLEGQVWKDSAWIVSAPTGTADIGTDDITWVQFSRVSGIYANDGLAQDGNRIYVRTDGTTIHLDEDDIAVKSSTTQYQSLISDGTGGTAAWSAISLDEADATQNLLRRDRGGLGSDVSAFADQSLYVSNGAVTTEFQVGQPGQLLTVDTNGDLAWGYGLSGVSNSRQVALTSATGTISIGTAVPANSRVTSVTVKIDTAYDAGVGMIIGDGSNADSLATADEIDPQTIGLYKIDLIQHYSTSTQLSISISGTTANGSGYVIVDYIAS